MKRIITTVFATIVAFYGYSQDGIHLPLTAGPGNPLTGDLHQNGSDVVHYLGDGLNKAAIKGSSGKLYFYTGTTSYNSAAIITEKGTLLIGGTSVPYEPAWFGTSVMGKEGYDKVILGTLSSTYTGATIGGHNSGLNAWSDLNINGTSIAFRIGETESVRFNSGSSIFNGSITSSSLISSYWQPTGSASSDFYVDVEPGTRILRTRNWNTGSPNIAATGIHTGSGQFEGPLSATSATFNGNLNFNYSTGALRSITGGGYGGAFQLISDNSTASRYARMGIVNSDGAWIAGLTIANDYTATFDGSIVGSSASFTGNVGIGSTQTNSNLYVHGVIKSKEVKVEATVTVPDYVFEKSYNLKPLSVVEEFITQNKHLPDVPSATEIEKDGINVGNMQLGLLKKIEELTLHLIEQNKLNIQQNKRIEELEKQLKK